MHTLRVNKENKHVVIYSIMAFGILGVQRFSLIISNSQTLSCCEINHCKNVNVNGSVSSFLNTILSLSYA